MSLSKRSASNLVLACSYPYRHFGISVHHSASYNVRVLHSAPLRHTETNPSQGLHAHGNGNVVVGRVERPVQLVVAAAQHQRVTVLRFQGRVAVAHSDACCATQNEQSGHEHLAWSRGIAPANEVLSQLRSAIVGAIVLFTYNYYSILYNYISNYSCIIQFVQVDHA